MKKESLLTRFIVELNSWIYLILFALCAIALAYHPDLEIQKLTWFIAILLAIALMRWEGTR